MRPATPLVKVSRAKNTIQQKMRISHHRSVNNTRSAAASRIAPPVTTPVTARALGLMVSTSSPTCDPSSRESPGQPWCRRCTGLRIPPFSRVIALLRSSTAAKAPRPPGHARPVPRVCGSLRSSSATSFVRQRPFSPRVRSRSVSSGRSGREIIKRPSAINRPSRNASSTGRMVASGCLSSHREAASGELKTCVLLQTTLRTLTRFCAATMDITAEGGFTVSILAGVTSPRTGSPVPRHGDSMLAGRLKRTGKSKASSTHQANRVRPSNSKRCGVGRSVSPAPTILPCPSHSALGNWSSVVRTSSGDLPEAAAISSGAAVLPLANKSSVGGTISRKASPAMVLIGAVIRAASCWRSRVFMGCFLRGVGYSAKEPIVRAGACHRCNHPSLGRTTGRRSACNVGKHVGLRSRGLDQAAGERVSRGVRSAPGSYFCVDVRYMALDCPDAHVQLFGDLAVGLPAGQAPQHLHLPRRQPVRVGPGKACSLRLHPGYSRFLLHRPLRLCLVEEHVDGTSRRLAITEVGRRRLALQDDQARVRYPGGQRASDFDRKPRSVAPVEHQGRCLQLRQELCDVEGAHRGQRSPHCLRSDALPQVLGGVAPRLARRPSQGDVHARIRREFPVLVHQPEPASIRG